MSFIVITSAEAYDAITEAGEMPGLLALGVEIVLVRPLYDELGRDPATAAFIAAHTPPFFIVRLHPWSRVYTAVADYMRNHGRDRFAAGERGVVVMAEAGDWITFNREPNRYLAIAGPGCVNLIRTHLEGPDR